MKLPHRLTLLSAVAFSFCTGMAPPAYAQDQCQRDIDVGFAIMSQVRSRFDPNLPPREACAYTAYGIGELLRAREMLAQARCDAARRNESVGIMDIVITTFRDFQTRNCANR